MKTISYIVLLLTGFALAGCDSLKQEVSPDRLAKEPEKLVVAFFISPQDTVLAARVGRSSTVLGQNSLSFFNVLNAVVTLSDGSRSVSLTNAVLSDRGFNPYYRATPEQLPIVAGKTYTLTVSVPNGQTVTATCTVPGPVALDNVLIDSTIRTEIGLAYKEYFARLRWRDPAGQINYYRAAGQNDYFFRDFIFGSPNTPPRDTLIRQPGSWFFSNGSTITDVGQDGQEMVSGRGRLAVAFSFQNGQQTISLPQSPLTAHLLNVDVNYYRYHDEVDRQSRAGRNPFAEPVLIQTNIRGGLGCFGAYNKSTLVTELK